MAKPKIRHLAIITRDTEKVAAFYKSVFEMEVIRDADGGIFLSDGYLTLAILPHRLEGSSAVGLNHFGFTVDSRSEIAQRIAEQGLEDPKPRPANRPYAEYRAADPEGNMFDLSEHGFERAELTPAREAVHSR